MVIVMVMLALSDPIKQRTQYFLSKSATGICVCLGAIQVLSDTLGGGGQ